LAVAGVEKQHASQPSLDTLHALVADDMSAVNRLIVENMQSQVALIPRLAGHLVASGGKRLRPMLTLASAGLCGYRGERHAALAACVEFIHTATLLHDDVVDQSELRRGQESANTVWGNQASVLVGDFLFSRAFELMVADGSLEVLRILSGASAVIAEGEVMQLITTNDTETTEAAYLEVIRAKTATLFAAAAEIGAVVAGRPAAEQAALADYGMNLGIAFQLIDDVLDYSALQAQLGKTVGDDFREGKMSLPVVLAYGRADADERAFWTRTMADMEQRDDDLGAAIALLNKHKALEETVARASRYGEAAHRALSVFPDTPVRAAMMEAVDFAVSRAY
jgi:octaprenyl-diphosphate synthase